MYNINALIKIAGMFDSDAGVGTARENSITRFVPVYNLSNPPDYTIGSDTSYFGRLYENAASGLDKDRVADHSPNNQIISVRRGPRGSLVHSAPIPPKSYKDYINPESNLTQKWIDAARKSMAEAGANEIWPQDKGRRTPAWNRVFDNLIHAGKENQSEFRSSGKVHKRDAFELDQHRLGPQLRNLTPEQKQRLLQLQNMQVRSFGQPSRKAVV